MERLAGRGRARVEPAPPPLAVVQPAGGASGGGPEHRTRLSSAE